MNIQNIPLEDNIPNEFRNIAVASHSFYKVRSPLDDQQSSGKLISCSVLLTKMNDFIEIENQSVKRTEELKDIVKPKKIIVHHEFLPFRRLVVILTEGKSVHLFDFENLKKVNAWESMSDVSSVDSGDVGRPSLVLVKDSGESHTVSPEDFLIETSVSRDGGGRQDAITVLNNKVMSIIHLAERLETERLRKELFICQKMSTLADQLQNGGKKIEKNKIPGVSPDGALGSTSSSIATSSSAKPELTTEKEEPVLKVLYARQRIINDKWVICVSLVNRSERHLVRNVDMVLHMGKGLKSLRYTTKLVKTFQWTTRNGVPTSGDISVEAVDPPILKQKKKAFLIAICDMPDFSSGETVMCDGIVTFETSNSKAAQDGVPMRLQIPFPSVSLQATNLRPVCVNLTKDQGGGGLPLDVFALIASSKRHKMMIRTRGTPLYHAVESLARDQRIIQIPNLSQMYCFNTAECQALHLASFVCKLLSPNHLALTTYTKDENQGMILMHNLKALLPCDSTVELLDDSLSVSTHSSDGLQNLLVKMQCVILKIQHAFNAQNEEASTTKMQKRRRSDAHTSNTTMATSWSNKDYARWRREIHALWLEMEVLLKQQKMY